MYSRLVSILKICKLFVNLVNVIFEIITSALAVSVLKRELFNARTKEST